MKSTLLFSAFFAIILSTHDVLSQDVVIPLAPQKELLKSDNPRYTANKKLVYDMWRELLEGGHLELAKKYFTETYIQRNPNVPSGRQSLVDAFSKFTESKPIVDSIKAKVVSIIAEGDLVVISFVSEREDPKDKSQKYTTTWFDMFRIENGKIAEHWDGGQK